jgi:hypothetical protein
MLKDSWIAREDGWVNATELTKEGNKLRALKGRKPARIGSYMETRETKEFVAFIKKQENIRKVTKGVIGYQGATWMHPIVALDYSWYLSSEDKLEGMAEVREMILKGAK